MYNLGKTGRTRDARVFLFLLGYSQRVSSLNDDLLSDELTQQEVSFRNIKGKPPDLGVIPK